LALQYIGDPTVSINEMTYLLGYSEPVNFSRAFKGQFRNNMNITADRNKLRNARNTRK